MYQSPFTFGVRSAITGLIPETRQGNYPSLVRIAAGDPSHLLFENAASELGQMIGDYPEILGIEHFKTVMLAFIAYQHARSTFAAQEQLEIALRNCIEKERMSDTSITLMVETILQDYKG